MDPEERAAQRAAEERAAEQRAAARQAAAQAAAERQAAAARAAERRRLWARYQAISDEELREECAFEAFVASGPGGQHRNKTETGVRLRHLPSGLVARATERRSREQNLGAALERLRAMLVAEYAPPPPPRKATRPSRGSVERRLKNKMHQSRLKQDRRGE